MGSLMLVVFLLVTMGTVGAGLGALDELRFCRKYRGSPRFTELDCRYESQYDRFVLIFWIMLVVWAVTALGAALVLRNWRRSRRASTRVSG